MPNESFETIFRILAQREDGDTTDSSADDSDLNSLPLAKSQIMSGDISGKTDRNNIISINQSQNNKDGH